MKFRVKCSDCPNRKLAPLTNQVILNLHFHDLRHTFTSLIPLHGAKPKVISKALGHSSVAFTMDTYSHIIDGMQKDAMALVDEVTPEGKYKTFPNNNA